MARNLGMLSCTKRVLGHDVRISDRRPLLRSVDRFPPVERLALCACRTREERTTKVFFTRARRSTCTTIIPRRCIRRIARIHVRVRYRTSREPKSLFICSRRGARFAGSHFDPVRSYWHFKLLAAWRDEGPRTPPTSLPLQHDDAAVFSAPIFIRPSVQYNRRSTLVCGATPSP